MLSKDETAVLLHLAAYGSEEERGYRNVETAELPGVLGLSRADVASILDHLVERRLVRGERAQGTIGGFALIRLITGGRELLHTAGHEVPSPAADAEEVAEVLETAVAPQAGPAMSVADIARRFGWCDERAGEAATLLCDHRRARWVKTPIKLGQRTLELT